MNNKQISETDSNPSCMFEGGDDDSDIDNIDFNNFKGIYIDEDPNRKYQDPDSGCHFEYYDLCKRMAKLKQLRKKLDEQLGLPPETPEPAKDTRRHLVKKSQDARAKRKSSNGINLQSAVNPETKDEKILTQTNK